MFIGTFVLMIAFSIILGQIGAPILMVMLWMLSFAVGTYVFAGFFANTFRFSTFHDADRRSSPVFAGMAIASGAISGQALLLAPGAIHEFGVGFLVLYSGTLLGLVLGGILFSAALSRSPASTFAGFVFSQGSNPFHTLFVVTIVCVTSLMILLAQLKLMGMLADSFFGIRETTFVNLVLGISAAYLVAGGMPALNMARVLGYAGFAFGILAPAIWISFKVSGNPVPQFAFGSAALQPVLEIDREMIEAGFATADQLPMLMSDYHSVGIVEVLILVVGISFGVAAMPHLLQHYGTLKKGRIARKAGIWSLLFAAIVLSVVPAIAIFARYNLYTSLLGLQISELSFEAPWLFSISGANGLPLITICGALVSSTADVLAACHVPMDSFIGIQDIGINPDYLMLGSAIMAELPSVVTVALVCGAFFCVFSTMDGVILSTANTLTKDVYDHISRLRSPPGFRLFINRLFILGVCVVTALIYPSVAMGPQMLFMSALALGCATLFPVLTSRIWLKLFLDSDLIAGLAAGFVTCLVLLTVVIVGFDFQLSSGDEWHLGPRSHGAAYGALIAGFIGCAAFFAAALGFREARKKLYRQKRIKRADVPT